MMSKVLIVYGTTTGNTAMVAEQITKVMQENGIEVITKNVIDTMITELGNGYDLTLLGSSTWGDDEIEFQEDFEPFFYELDKADLNDKKVAIFGCGDSGYEYFCGAVDMLEEKMDEIGAEMVGVSLRIDGDPDDYSSEISDWASEVSAGLKTVM